MIESPIRPYLVRCINLPISKFGNYDQFLISEDSETPASTLKENINIYINHIDINDGIILFNKNYDLFTRWLTYQSQKIVTKIGINIHTNFKIEDFIRGYIINRIPDEKFKKEYWQYFNNKYKDYP